MVSAVVVQFLVGRPILHNMVHDTEAAMDGQADEASMKERNPIGGHRLVCSRLERIRAKTQRLLPSKDGHRNERV